MTITGKAAVAGVIGWPISHSLSPRLHGYWLDRLGLDGAYVPLAVKPEDAAAALRALPRMGFRGVNVTVPHKRTAFEAADDLTPRAIRIGAVNTIIVGADGGLTGDNTDGYGFQENLAAGAPGFDIGAGPAVVIGAGGAARAILAALIEAGAPEIRLLNRTTEKALSLAAELGRPIIAAPWEKRHACLAGAALLVNTTTRGMAGNPALDLRLDHLPETALVNDIVYVPLLTPLLAAAAARGNPCVDGLGMLLHQGRPGFEAWFGVRPAVDDALRAWMLAALKQ